MEQETKMSPHVWIYPDRNSKRDNDEGLWGGGVEGEDETRDRQWAGSGRNIVRSWAQCSCLCCSWRRLPLFLAALDSTRLQDS